MWLSWSCRSKFKSYHLDVWCQAYLAGVQKLVIGIKDKNSRIRSIKEHSPDEYLEVVGVHCILPYQIHRAR